MIKIKTIEIDGVRFPTIALRRDSGELFGFTFGLQKAKLILDNLEEIKKFVADNENKGA